MKEVMKELGKDLIKKPSYIDVKESFHKIAYEHYQNILLQISVGINNRFILDKEIDSIVYIVNILLENILNTEGLLGLLIATDVNNSIEKYIDMALQIENYETVSNLQKISLKLNGEMSSL